MSFHFQRNFQLKIFHRDRDRHNDRRSTYFCKICKNSENIFKKYLLNFCKFCNSRWNDGHCDDHGHGEKVLTGNFAENEMT